MERGAVGVPPRGRRQWGFTHLARRIARVERDRAFLTAERGQSRRLTRTFAIASAFLILLLLVADDTLLAPGISKYGALSALTLVVLAGIGLAVDGIETGRLPAAFFAAATLLLVAIVLLQLEEQPAQVFGFHLAGMAPVAVAVFARWPFRWQLSWLLAMAGALTLVQAVPLFLDSPLDTTGQFIPSFVAGALVSVGVFVVLRLERYRARVLLARIDAVGHRALRAKADLAASLAELRQSQLVIRKLEGILPTCAMCGRVRTDDDAEWMSLADYLTLRGAVSMSHGYCPECMARVEADFDLA